MTSLSNTYTFQPPFRLSLSKTYTFRSAFQLALSKTYTFGTIRPIQTIRNVHLSW